MLRLALCLLVISLAACGVDGEPRGPRAVATGEDSGMPTEVPPAWTPPGRLGRVPEEAQRQGDPERGLDVLLNYGYVTCGVPYQAFVAATGGRVAGTSWQGRTGRNEDLPYALTATTSPRGVEIVAPNCLSCHVGAFDGKLIMGLGNANADFTTNTGVIAQLSGAFVEGEAERAEWQYWVDRMSIVGPRTVIDTVGVTSADNLGAVLMAHRDPATLEWLPTARLPYPPLVVPVDTPPWWRIGKKNALYYTASGRGDHARLMMTAALLCTDSIEEAQRIDEQFNHVRAYLEQLEAPEYPYAIDEALAERGHGVFEATCSRCHGYYDDDPSYPNLVIGLSRIGTDPLLAAGTGAGGSAFGTGDYVGWYNESWFGETSRLEPAGGYIAPPLDGVWATGPFLHNGSVPTIALMLNSTQRPTYWRRASQTTTDFDEETLGFAYEVLEGGKDSVPDDQRTRVYDTTRPGYGNQGHTFGDRLSEEDRRAVLEYLKTL